MPDEGMAVGKRPRIPAGFRPNAKGCPESLRGYPLGMHVRTRSNRGGLRLNPTHIVRTMRLRVCEGVRAIRLENSSFGDVPPVGQCIL